MRKAWLTELDDGLYEVYFAETAGQAKRVIASELGMDFIEVRVKRGPRLDDLAALHPYAHSTTAREWMERGYNSVCDWCEATVSMQGEHHFDRHGNVYCSTRCFDHSKSRGA